MADFIQRSVRGVDDKIRLGPDAQVDDKALVFPPTDPARTDPFLVLSEDWFSTPGFDWHPHRGLETVTIVLDGVLEHGDSLGHAGALEPGDVQWMTAGRGIIHRELAFRDEHAHTLQLWLNLPADLKLVPTRYQDVRAADQAVHAEPGVRVAVISGETGAVRGPAANHWPILGLRLTIEPTVTYTQVLPANYRAFAYVLAGQVEIAGAMVRTGQIAWSDPLPSSAASGLPLRVPDSETPANILLFAGAPIGQPVVFGGPFVMNTEAEIAKAYHDLRTGQFGETPRQARLLTR